MKSCCNTTWLFDQGINSPFVCGKRGISFNCASFSWAAQFVLFSVMFHRVRRMSALPVLLQQLNLVGISQGFHQHKVSADFSFPVGNDCEAVAWPGGWKWQTPFWVWIGLSEIKSQLFWRSPGRITHHWTTRNAKLCLHRHSLGWDLQYASAALVCERSRAQVGTMIEGQELLLAVLFRRHVCTGIGVHAQMCPYAQVHWRRRQVHKDIALT